MPLGLLSRVSKELYEGGKERQKTSGKDIEKKERDRERKKKRILLNAVRIIGCSTEITFDAKSERSECEKRTTAVGAPWRDAPPRARASVKGARDNRANGRVSEREITEGVRECPSLGDGGASETPIDVEKDGAHLFWQRGGEGEGRGADFIWQE